MRKQDNAVIRAGIRDYFRLKADARGVGAEVDEEIAFHLEERVRHLVARGHTEEVARAEAERRFGSLAHARLTLQRSATRREYRMSIRGWFNDWRTDFGYTARSLVREPLVSVVVVATLALGIGANATMFGIIDRLLLRGPGHIMRPADVKRMYFTQHSFAGGSTSANTAPVVYTALKSGTHSFEGVALYSARTFRIGQGEESHEITVGTSSWDMFPLLGVKPVLGRFYDSTDDKPGAALVAVIDYEVWRKEFGGARDVLGKKYMLGKTPYTIIGVSPKGFTGPEMEPRSAWISLSAGEEPTSDWATSWCCTGPSLITRLKAGVTPEAAGSDATRAYRSAALIGGDSTSAQGTVSARPIGFGPEGTETTEAAVTRWLGGVSLVVLLVACANVINLLLARSIRRRREISIRLAMGISRSRLVRLLLTEGLLLSIAGAFAAIVLAYWGGHFVRATLLPDVQWDSPINPRVLLFSAAVAIVVGIIVGLAPALESGKQDLSATLRSTTKQGGSQSRGHLRESLTILQAALSLVLLVGAGLFVRSLRQIDRMDLGIDANQVVTVWSSVPPDTSGGLSRFEGMMKAIAFYNQQAYENVRSRADVEAAALAIGSPLGSNFGVTLRVPGYDSIPKLAGGGPFISAVTPSYFRTVGTQLRKGRTFAETEGAGTAAVVIVNETMARTLWPGEDALTKCLVVFDKEGPCRSVVGIVENVHRTGLREEPSMQYYVPWGQEKNIGGAKLLVRPKGSAKEFIPTLRKSLYGLTPRPSFVQVQRLSERLDPQIRPWRLGATLFIAFGALALVISAVGLFSLIAYSVTQRRSEIGIRLALGARANGIVTLVLAQGIRLACAGILLGIMMVLLASKYIEPLLFDTSARDLATIGSVSLVLVLTTIVACVLPAFRARAVNPVEALRAE